MASSASASPSPASPSSDSPSPDSPSPGSSSSGSSSDAPRPLLAMIAHDGKKADLVSFAHKHRPVLDRFQVVATGTTGQMLIDEIALDVQRYRSGPVGGDVQIAARIVEGDVYAVLFFIDPLGKHPHEPDIQTLLRACNVHNVPIATNEATARLIVEHGSVERAFEERP